MSVIEINHPLIEHKMTILRSVETDTKSFREKSKWNRKTYDLWGN